MYKPRDRSGFTLIEVMIAAIVLAVAILGLMSLIPTVTQLTETTQEGNLALNASLQMSEAIRQYADADFVYVWKAYNGITADDPNGAGTAPGNVFSVSGLQNAAGSSQVGSITFYTDENGTGNAALNAKLGMPKDLDSVPGTSADVSATYTLLPFRIAVDWKDHSGHPRHTEIFSQVASY